MDDHWSWKFKKKTMENKRTFVRFLGDSLYTLELLHHAHFGGLLFCQGRARQKWHSNCVFVQDDGFESTYDAWWAEKSSKTFSDLKFGSNSIFLVGTKKRVQDSFKGVVPVLRAMRKLGAINAVTQRIQGKKSRILHFYDRKQLLYNWIEVLWRILAIPRISLSTAKCSKEPLLAS